MLQKPIHKGQCELFSPEPKDPTALKQGGMPKPLDLPCLRSMAAESCLLVLLGMRDMVLTKLNPSNKIWHNQQYYCRIFWDWRIQPRLGAGTVLGPEDHSDIHREQFVKYFNIIFCPAAYYRIQISYSITSKWKCLYLRYTQAPLPHLPRPSPVFQPRSNCSILALHALACQSVNICEHCLIILIIHVLGRT